MQNLKTTGAAGVSALGSFVLFSQALHMIVWPPWALALALFAHVGGMAQFGVSAKDAGDLNAHPPTESK